MTKLIVERSIDIHAPASRVWAILTKPEYTQVWAGLFGAKGPIDSDWTLGSKVLWRNAEGEVYVYGNVMAVEPGSFLRFTVRSVNPDMHPISGLEEDDLTQTYAVSEHAEGTVLSIAHGDFSKLATGEEIYPRAMPGWDTILQKLKALAEGRD